jgi:hypothetical protein
VTISSNENRSGNTSYNTNEIYKWNVYLVKLIICSDFFLCLICFMFYQLWPWKLIGFQTLLRTKYVPSLFKIHGRMLILECSQGCYRVQIRPCDLDLWPWTSIGLIFLKAE